MNLKAFAIAACLAFAAASPALAQDEGPWRVGETYVVRSEALDLAQPAGRARLLDAIEGAATRACAEYATRGARKSCREQAMERALARAPSYRTAIALARLERGDTRLAMR